jgi:ParB-like chromosome segregation protein Spo0J
MSEIPVPMSERVKLSELQFDKCNPNVMSKDQLERLKTSIKKWGDIVPIITNKDLLVADGQQRFTAMKELGMTECSVIRLPVEDVDHRLLRQVLNKLRGEHSFELDADEFQRIIDAGREKDLKYMLDLSDEKLEKYINEQEPESIDYVQSFEVIIKCDDETQQEAIYTKLRTEGYNCRVSTL